MPRKVACNPPVPVGVGAPSPSWTATGRRKDRRSPRFLWVKPISKHRQSWVPVSQRLKNPVLCLRGAASSLRCCGSSALSRPYLFHLLQSCFGFGSAHTSAHTGYSGLWSAPHRPAHAQTPTAGEDQEGGQRGPHTRSGCAVTHPGAPCVRALPPGFPHPPRSVLRHRNRCGHILRHMDSVAPQTKFL